MKPAILQRLSALEAKHSAPVIEDAWARDWRKAVEGDPWPILEVLLDEGQVSWLRDFHETDDDWGWLIGRQRGKSDAALAYATVRGVDKTRPEGFRTKYCALTKDTALEISSPILNRILERCPDSIAPFLGPSVDEHGRPQPRVLQFPTNPKSNLKIFGTDAESFRKGRGGNCHLILADEFGFYQKPEQVMSALSPSLQTTNGRTLHLSTPAEEPGHFWTELCRNLRAIGRLIHDTWLSNPRINHDAIASREAAKRGQTLEEFKASTYYKREFLALEVTEESRAAMPAWTALGAGPTHPLVVDFVRPRYFTAYVALDWGGVSNDPHAALFLIHDPVSQDVLVEGESEMRGKTMAEWVVELKAKEKELWGVNRWEGTLLGAGEFDRLYDGLPPFLKTAISQQAPEQPYLRVCDHDEQLMLELLRHGYATLPTRKDSKHLAVDEANNLIRQKRLKVHPRCKRFIEQLTTTVWNDKRTEWVRTPKDHGDLVDDYVYASRNVRWHRDPRPAIDSFMTTERPKKSGWAGLGGRRVTRY